MEKSHASRGGDGSSANTTEPQCRDGGDHERLKEQMARTKILESQMEHSEEQMAQSEAHTKILESQMAHAEEQMAQSEAHTKVLESQMAESEAHTKALEDQVAILSGGSEGIFTARL